MILPSFEKKCLHSLDMRVQAYVSDKYRVVSRYRDDDVVFICMVHCNGNRVSLLLNMTLGYILERKNKAITKVVEVR